MTMWVRPATPPDVEYVARNMKDRDYEEFSCISFCDSRVSLARGLALRYGTLDGVFAYGRGVEAIAIAGYLELRPRVVSLLFFSTEALPTIILPLTRHVTRTLWPELRAAGVHRLECDSLDTNAETHRWLETLGLRREGTMAQFGRDGERFARYAWTEGEADGSQAAA